MSHRREDRVYSTTDVIRAVACIRFVFVTGVSEIGFDGIKRAPLPSGSLSAGLGHALNESLVVLKSIINPGIFVSKPDDDRRRAAMPSHENLLRAGPVHELG
jgi:hypothetical protein